MNKMILLFEEFLLKAIVMTETIIQADFKQGDELTRFTDNRERLFSILGQISQKIDWSLVEDINKDEINRKIDYLKKLDEKLLVSLQEYKLEVKKEIEQTFRQKENVKGYNLNDTK
jgi:hypothetical protein